MVSWFKDGQSILLYDGVIFVLNGMLIIWVFKVEDSGNYMCIVSSWLGIDSVIFFVIVLSKGYFFYLCCFYIYLEYVKISKMIIKVWCIFNYYIVYYSNQCIKLFSGFSIRM